MKPRSTNGALLRILPMSAPGARRGDEVDEGCGGAVDSGTAIAVDGIRFD